jgi:hypothetical protein
MWGYALPNVETTTARGAWSGKKPGPVVAYALPRGGYSQQLLNSGTLQMFRGANSTELCLWISE